MAKNLVDLKINNTSYTNRPIGNCTTAASTAAKVVTCPDFVLVTNATILVRFAIANTATSPTLNVNSTGAKSIRYNGSTSIGNKIKAGFYEFIYDGTDWLCLGGIDTTYGTATTSALGLIMIANQRDTSPGLTIGGTTANRYYGVELAKNGKAFVNVPWIDTTYGVATEDALGLIKLGTDTGLSMNDGILSVAPNESSTDNNAYPILFKNTPGSTGTSSPNKFNQSITINPSTQTLGLGVLNCTTNNSNDNSNEIDIFANRQLPTAFWFTIPEVVENIAPATSINLMYSGPGVTSSEARGESLSIGPNIVDDTTTNGFLISTDKPLHIEAQGVAFGSHVIPNQGDSYNLGNSTNKWNEVHANSFKGTADSARLTPYGFCETASSTAAKVVTTSVPFVLEAGARISVKFKYNHTGTSGITLQVNDDPEAKSVLLNGSAVGSYIILANNIYDFIYDGTNWILQPGVQNTAGSSTSSSKLFLIGATSQSTSGVRTYSNSNVYTQSGAIYTKGGFYDMSTTIGASVHKAIVPKDYTEDLQGSSISGSHSLNSTLTTTVPVSPPYFGGLVGEYKLTVGTTKVLTITPTMANSTYSTTLAITLNVDESIQNFRFVRLLLSVPLTISNTSSYPTTFNYVVQVRLNNGSYKTTTRTFPLSANTVKLIDAVSIICDLMKGTIIDDTDNSTRSWC